VQQQIDARLDRGLRALASQGMRTEDMRNLDFDRLRAAQRSSATAEVKGSILLDRIADAEKINLPRKKSRMSCRRSLCKCANRWIRCARV